MVFSSNLFLYVFLLPFLLIYFGLYWSFRSSMPLNAVLLIASIGLYFWSNGSPLIALVATVFITYGLAVSIEQGASERHKRTMLILGIVFNLGVLVYFKYFTFFVSNFAPADISKSLLSLHQSVALPVGISFYTFMAISFLIESYKGIAKPSGLLNFSTYLTMFPHLVAGPIVRFSEIDADVRARRLTIDQTFEGLWRFAIGLSKKVILANPLGEAADRIFALPVDQLDPQLAWVGALAYTFQIFFDFSGYTDMAIGIALMLGFRFPENFNNPYRATSITDFWRRWHMTLTRWFRDYLYIPLGGNRGGLARTLINLFAVFLLCGLWHGAAWTFVVWGAYHGVLLVIDRVAFKRFGVTTSGIPGTAITFFFVVIGWVFFRSETLQSSVGFLKTMFFLQEGSPPQPFVHYAPTSVLFYMGIAALFSFVPVERAFQGSNEFRGALLRGATAVALVWISLVALSDASYAPFIYFRF